MGPDPEPPVCLSQGESGPSGPAGPTGARGAPVSTEDPIKAPSLALLFLHTAPHTILFLFLLQHCSYPLGPGGCSSGTLPLTVPPAHLTPHSHVRASLQFTSFSSRETVVSLVLLALLALLAPL